MDGALARALARRGGWRPFGEPLSQAARRSARCTSRCEGKSPLAGAGYANDRTIRARLPTLPPGAATGTSSSYWRYSAGDAAHASLRRRNRLLGYYYERHAPVWRGPDPHRQNGHPHGRPGDRSVAEPSEPP